MKIAILTLTPSNNYGGILQTLALYNTLKDIGHDVILINKVFHYPFWKRYIFKILELIPCQNIKGKREGKVKSLQLKSFINEHIPNISKTIVSNADLGKFVDNEGIQAVIVGSDQVWRYQYIKDGYHTIFFLDFQSVRKVKKIAYAASFGKDEWELADKKTDISILLKKFDAVSTREKSGIDICKKTFDIHDVNCVLDPTLLFESNYYDKIMKTKSSAAAVEGIVTYILDSTNNKQKVIDFVKEKLRLSGVNQKEISLAKANKGHFYLVEEWLSTIKHAKFMVTDSFHGMVFAIIFNINFIVIGNHARGISRFKSLLEQLGLEKRLITNVDNLNDLSKIINQEIKYQIVNEKIDNLKKYSNSFLINAIEK